LSTTDSDDRSDVISQLGDLDSTEALQALARLFQGEQSSDLRVQILSTAADMGDDDDQAVKNQKLNLYSSALTSGQPDDVRETAVDSMEQLDDPRTISLWQSLLKDPDEDIRDSAQAAVERYSQPDN
jgi:HEAT repeat protein